MTSLKPMRSSNLDTLRGLSLVGVILYHLKIFGNSIAYLQGGFLGVDMFFTISGIVVTLSVLNDSSGRSNSLNFLIKRVNRLLPPLLVLSITSSIAAYFILFPGNLVQFTKAQLSAITFISNYFHWVETGGYGAADANLFPFLHTWSLAVEMQFYAVLVFIFFICGKNSKYLFLAVSMLSFMSFSFSYNPELFKSIIKVFPFSVDENFFFYDSITRMWQFGCGVLIAIFLSKSSKRLKFNRFTFLTSLILIITCFYKANFQESSDIILLKLVIILVITIFACTNDARTITLDFKLSKYLQTIGRKSYSYYLFHFPIFVFISQLFDAYTGVILAFALTIIFSEISFLIFEKKWQIKTILLSILATTLISVGVFATNGAEYRYKINNNYTIGIQKYRNEWINHKDMSSGLKYQGLGKTKVMIVGNSHGRDVFNMFTTNQHKFAQFQFSFTTQPKYTVAYNFQLSCIKSLIEVDFVSSCSNHNYDWKQLRENFRNAEIIVLATRFNGGEPTFLAQTIKDLQSKGKRVVVFGNTVEYPVFEKIPGIIHSKIVLPPLDQFVLLNERLPTDNELKQLQMDFYQQTKRHFDINNEVKTLTLKNRAGYVDRSSYMCKTENQQCLLLTPAGEKIIYDYGHLSLEGAKYLGSLETFKDSFISALNHAN